MIDKTLAWIRSSRWASYVVPTCIGVYILVGSSSPDRYGILLAPLLALALLWVLLRQGRPPLVAIAWPVILSSMGVIGFLIGAQNDNPGATSLLTIFVFEPVVVGALFALALREPRGASDLRRILDLTVIVVATLGILLYVARLRGWSTPTAIYGNYSAIDLDGVIRTNYQGYNSFVFLLAYGAIHWVASPRSWWRAGVAAAALSGLVLAGRQALYLSVPVIVLFAVAVILARHGWIAAISRRAWKWIFVGVSSVVLLGIASLSLLGMDPLERVLGGDSGGVRSEQASELLDAARENPWWGAGSGAIVPGYSRSDHSPWLFELTYHTLFLYFGALGCAVLLAWAIWKARYLSRAFLVRDAGFAQAVAAGWVTTLLAAATNPYLFRLEGMWMVMLPFGMATLYAVERRPSVE